MKLFNKLNWIPFFEQAKLTKCSIIYKRLQGHVPTYLRSLLSLLAALIHGRPGMPNSIFLVLQSNVKPKEAEYLLWLPVKPGTVHLLPLSMRKIAFLNSVGTLFGRKILKNSSFLIISFCDLVILFVLLIDFIS